MTDNNSDSIGERPSDQKLPDICAEGERLANETPRTNGTYLWTDLVGAIQTGIAEERARHVPLA